MNIVISSLDDMRLFSGKITHLISVVDPDDATSIPAMGVPRESRLLLICDDVYSQAEARERRRETGFKCVAPTKAMVKKALTFARRLPEQATLLVHCTMGVSRSPAMAFAILCQAQPDLTERQVFRQLLKLRPQACPSHLIVTYADQLLGRDGRMLRAMQAALKLKK